MYRVGLTGGVGSGKSTVARLFAENGVSLIDCDTIARDLTTCGGAALPALFDEFGEPMRTTEGGLDRAAMRTLVFSDPRARERLEAILHPMIADECEQQAKAAAGTYLMLEIPLLAEKPEWRARCQRVLVVDCLPRTQIKRLVETRAWTQAEAQAIVGAQASREARLAVADDVIENNGVAAALIPQVVALHSDYSRRVLQAAEV